MLRHMPTRLAMTWSTHLSMVKDYRNTCADWRKAGHEKRTLDSRYNRKLVCGRSG